MGDLVEIPPGIPKADVFDQAIGDVVRPIGKWDMPKVTDGGNGRPMTSWDETRWLKKHEDELRSRAAEIAVDMETGQWPGRDAGPYSMEAIQEAMGYSATVSRRLLFMRDPEFARAVTWERSKREFNLHASVNEIRPLMNVGLNAGVIELTRRLLETPRSVKTTELIEIINKYLQHLGADRADKPKDVRTTINVFLANANLLPLAAREKALGLFSNELRALSRMAGQIDEAS